MEVIMKIRNRGSSFWACLCVLSFTCLGFISCDLLGKKWSEACNDPFDRVRLKAHEASIEVQGGVIILRFPYHVVGSMTGYSDGRYGLPEAVDQEYREPGTSFPLNTLRLPLEAQNAPTVIELGPGSGVSLEGFDRARSYSLQANWDFPQDWKNTYKQDLCSHSCYYNNREGDLTCGVHWSQRYALNEEQLQGTVTITSLGTEAGENVELEILGIATDIDLSEEYQDCCGSLHIRMKGTVGQDGVIVLEDYCANPKSFCDGCQCLDWLHYEDNIFMNHQCAAHYESVEEQLGVCWGYAYGIEPY
jgi:hypothetical protein